MEGGGGGGVCVCVCGGGGGGGALYLLGKLGMLGFICFSKHETKKY